MIAFIEGKVLSVSAQAAVIFTHGLGYQVMFLKNTLATLTIGDTISAHIHTVIKEDAFDLYGFLENNQKTVFQLCLQVSGIGPKIALAILSTLSVEDFLGAVIAQKVALLTNIPGIGKKGAERLVLELKDKAIKINLTSGNTAAPSLKENLQLALTNLGYSREQSLRIQGMLSAEDFQLPFESLIKKALGTIASHAS